MSDDEGIPELERLKELEEEVRRAHAEVMRLEAALEEPRHQLAEAEAAQAR